MLRRKRKAPADPIASLDVASLPQRWVPVVTDAFAVRTRWRSLVDGIRPGPVRDRLVELGDRLDVGVLAVWETVERAVEAQRVAETLDADRVTDEYKRAKRDPAADPALVEALQARFSSVQRILNAVDDTDQRLRLLEARLGATVARAAEVSLSAQPDDDFGAELDGVVGELTALRDALSSL